MSTKPHVRFMIRRDLPEVMDIERLSFEFPWYEEDFIRCLRQRNCMAMAAELGETVVGFAVYELHACHLHILNFAVHPKARRKRIGSAMIDKFKGKLSSQRRTRLTLEIRESNVAAQMFFKSQGFLATEIVRDFYDDSPEDAYVFEYQLDEDDWWKSWNRSSGAMA